MIWDILIIVGAIAVVVGVSIAAIIRKKKGCTGCADCPYHGKCHACPSKPKEEKTDEK
ncbi:MAG: FeoB-associated Cys-rich membrane protein [Clostridiales bacterium]|nr:FeoB-associated Cys-rich membrane protein [Clostridiales bacterium]